MGQERLNGLAILSIEKSNHASPLLCLKGVVRQVYRTVLSQLVGLDVQIRRQNELYRIVSSHDQIDLTLDNKIHITQQSSLHICI